MASRPVLHAEFSAHLIAQLRIHIRSTQSGTVGPTDYRPGSKGKIALLRERYERCMKRHDYLSLHDPDDARIREGWGYKITKGRNGRITSRTEVQLDQAYAQELARNEYLVDEHGRVLREIEEGFAVRAGSR